MEDALIYELAAMDGDDWRMMCAGMDYKHGVAVEEDDDFDLTDLDVVLGELFDGPIPGKADWCQIFPAVETIRSEQAATDLVAFDWDSRNEYMKMYMRRRRNGVE